MSIIIQLNRYDYKLHGDLETGSLKMFVFDVHECMKGSMLLKTPCPTNKIIKPRDLL